MVRPRYSSHLVFIFRMNFRVAEELRLVRTRRLSLRMGGNLKADTQTID